MCADRHRGALHQPVEGGGAVELEATEHGVVVDRDIGQLDVECGLVIERVLPGHGHTHGVRLDEEQLHVTIGRAGRNDHRRREVGRRHDGLGAAQDPTALTAIGAGRWRPQVDRVTLGQSHREHDLARGHAGQEVLTLRFGAELGDRQCGDECGIQRDGRNRAADFLQEQARFEVAEAAPTDILRQHDAQQVGLGELRPEFTVEPFVAGLDLFQPFRCALVGQDLAGQIDDGVLFLGECEVHRCS